MPTQSELLDTVRHVVHDYANLVSSGTLVVTGGPPGQRLEPPLNTHVGDAFLCNCRKMYEFFKYPRLATKGKNNDDVGAQHYLQHLSGQPSFPLQSWDQWHAPMNKQLLHITLTRVTNPTPWRGHDETQRFLNEFKSAWKLFRSNLIEPYRSKFDQEIAARKLVQGFTGSDLD